MYDIDVNVDIINSDVVHDQHPSSSSSSSTPATGSARSETALAMLDVQLRAHVTRLMAVGGYGSASYNMATVDRIQASITDYDDDDDDRKKKKKREGDEKSFDVLVVNNTTGITNMPVDWVPANSADEQWTATTTNTGVVATPIKDADRSCNTAAVCARVETD